MVMTQGLTREQLRVAIGHNCGAVQLLTASAAGGATNTFKTTDLFTVPDLHNGKWLQCTGPTNNDGVTFRVADSSVASEVTTLTFTPVGTQPATSDTAELWERRFPPALIHQFINQALQEATGRVYPPEESLALHGDSRQLRYDVPSQFAMVNGIYYRTSVESKEIHEAVSEWDEATAPDNVTRSVDTEHYKGESANKFVIAGAFTTGLVSSKAVSSMDLSGYDYVEFWVESTITTVAGDFTLLLDNTALCVSALETLTIPALVADTPTFVRIALANPELDTAIISVGLNAANNIAANTVWIRKVRAVKDGTAVWVKVDDNNWKIDKQARDIVFKYAPGYGLLKLTGGSKPTLLSIAATGATAAVAAAADAAVCDINEQFVIARATELTLLAVGGGPSVDPDAFRALASYWHGMAEAAKLSLGILTDARIVN